VLGRFGSKRYAASARSWRIDDSMLASSPGHDGLFFIATTSLVRSSGSPAGRSPELARDRPTEAALRRVWQVHGTLHELANREVLSALDVPCEHAGLHPLKAQASSTATDGITIRGSPCEGRSCHRSRYLRNIRTRATSWAFAPGDPGSYTIVAVEDAWGFQWMQPGVLATYVTRTGPHDWRAHEGFRAPARPVEVQPR